MVNKKKLNKILAVVSLAALMSSVTVTTTQNYASADYSSTITSKMTSTTSSSETKTTGIVTKVDNNKVTVKLSDTTYGQNQGSVSQEQSSSNTQEEAPQGQEIVSKQGGAPQGQSTNSGKSKETTISRTLPNTSAVKDTIESTSSTVDQVSATSADKTSNTAATKKILPNTVAVKDTIESTSITTDSASTKATADSTSTITSSSTKASATTDKASKKSMSTVDKASTAMDSASAKVTTDSTSTAGFNPGQMGGPVGVQGGPGGQKGTPPQKPNGQAPQGQKGTSGQTTGTTMQNINVSAGRDQSTPPQMLNGQAPQDQKGTSGQTIGTTMQNINVSAGGDQSTPPQMPNGQAPQDQPRVGEQQTQGTTALTRNSNWQGKTLPKTSVQLEETYDLEGVKIVKETSNGEESASLSDIRENDVIEVYKDSSGNITKVVIKNKDTSKETITTTGQQGTPQNQPGSTGNSSKSGATTGQQGTTPPSQPGSTGNSSQIGATTGQQGTPPSKPGESGGFGGGSQQVTQGTAATNITEEKTVDGETYTSTGDDENALRVTGVKATLKNITVNKESGSSSNVESGDFYGMNAGLLATDGAEVNISGAKVETNAQNGNGVFSYGSGTIVNIENSTIKTTKDNSGGIQTTGGATTNAKNLTVNTAGNSSAAIRSDRGGGIVNVDGGNYTSTGYNSPAVYSTANITVKNANLTAENSEALVIEGQNSITIENSTVSGNMSDTNGSSSDNNVHNIMIYQSMSGDAEVGKSTFSMKDGKIINNNGDVIYVTNTTSEIYLSNTEIDNKETDGYLLNISGNDASRGWGTAGSNGGDVTFTADNQKLEGKIVVDTISKLNLTLKNNSVFTGTINITENEQNGTAVSDNAVVTIEEGSTWNLTGDSKITSLTNKGTINFNGYTITLADGTVLKG